MRLFWLKIFGISFLYGCNAFTVDDPSVSFHKENSLLPILSFETTEIDSVMIEFWKSEKPEVIRRSRPSAGKSHSIVLMNLTPETKYLYHITSLKSNSKSAEYSFNTGAVPEELIKVQKIITDSVVFDGYILLRRFYNRGVDIIVNNEGDIVWYHPYDSAVRRAFSFTNRHSIISIADTSRIIENDLLGNTLHEIDFVKSGNPQFVHHEILLDSEDNLVAIKSDSTAYDLRKVGGGQSDYVRGSGILKTNFRGEILWEWDLLDHIDALALIKSNQDARKMIGHANSIAIDQDGNYLLSLRDFSQIWKIDSKNGRVLWKIGKGGDFKMPEESYFIKQHSVHFNSQGELMMFDNGDYKIRPASRIVALKLNEQKHIAELGLIVNLPKSLSSYRMCSAYSISTDKHLICTSRKDGTLAVVNNLGQLLWKVTTNYASYRAYYIEDPFEVFEK